MAVLLSDNFNTGALNSSWVSSGTGISVIPLWGTSGTACVACGNVEPGTVFYHHGTYIPTAGAVRMRLALHIDPLDDDLSATNPTMSLINVGEFNFGPQTTNLQFLVYARRDGSITLKVLKDNAANTPHYTTSAPGIVPTDGTWGALQLRWTLTATSVTLVLTVNNVDAATLVSTGTRPWPAVGWQDVRLDSHTIYAGATPRSLTVIDDVEIDDSAAATAWPTIAGSTLDLTRVCNGLAPGPGPDPTPPDPPTHTRIRRLRRAPHLSADQAEQFFAKFSLDFEAGVGTGVAYGADPQLYLRWSDDGGQTWRGPLAVSAGLQGAFRRRAIWRRLGRGRDRVFEVSMDDPVKWALVAANLDAVKGTS